MAEAEVIVIGGGPAGLGAATELARTGLKQVASPGIAATILSACGNSIACCVAPTMPRNL
jgi:ribulose 1,5-bisphosphate synthetase/thiazole synthase